MHIRRYFYILLSEKVIMPELHILTEGFEPIIEKDKDDKGLLVFKALVARGDHTTSNHNYYSAEEFEKAAPGLVGKKVYKDHSTYKIENIVGKVRDASYDHKTNGFYATFEMDRNDPIASKITKGFITDVSLGGSCSHVKCNVCGEKIESFWGCPKHNLGEEYDGVVARKDIVGLTFEKHGELSLVTAGAADNKILSYMKESERIMTDKDKKSQEEIEKLRKEVEVLKARSEVEEIQKAKREAELEVLKKAETEALEEKRKGKYLELVTLCKEIGIKDAERWEDRNMASLQELIDSFSSMKPKQSTDLASEPEPKSSGTSQAMGSEGDKKPKTKTAESADENAYRTLYKKIFRKDWTKLPLETREHAISVGKK